MINIPGQIEKTNIAATRKGADRTGSKAEKSNDGTFSSFFTQYLEAGEKSQNKQKISKQNQEDASVEKGVKTGKKSFTLKKSPGGKRGQRVIRLKNLPITKISAGILTDPLKDKRLQNRKEGRFIQLMAENRSPNGQLRKRVLSLQGKKQQSLSALKKIPAGRNSTKERTVVLAKKYIAGKNRTYNKDVLKEGEPVKGGDVAKKSSAITESGKSDRKINSAIKRTRPVSIKDRTNDPSFTGSHVKKNAVSKTGESDNIRSGKTATGELITASVKYDSNVPRTPVKQVYQIHGNADEIFNDIVKKFSLVVKKGGGEARLVLQPEVLGQLKMKMSLNNHVVNTFMVVDNEAVKDLILGKLNILEQNLLQQGFNLGSFQVDVKDKNTGPGTSQDEAKNGHRIDDLDEEDSIPEIEKSSGVPWISTIVNLTA